MSFASSGGNNNNFRKSQSVTSSWQTSQTPSNPFDTSPSSPPIIHSIQSPPKDKDLPERIKQAIQIISQNCTQIRKYVDKIGTAKDSHENRQKMHQLIDETRELAHEASEDLKHFEIHGGSNFENKGKRAQQQKLMKDLKQWLEQFQTLVKHAGQKEQTTPLKLQPVETFDSFSEQSNEKDFQREEDMKRFQVLQTETDFNESLIREREEGIKDIEKTVKEVHEIFVDLSNLVSEQGEMIDNIESNVETSVDQTSKGVEELRAASKYQRSARTKMCILALILVIIAGVAVVTIYFLIPKK